MAQNCAACCAFLSTPIRMRVGFVWPPSRQPSCRGAAPFLKGSQRVDYPPFCRPAPDTVTNDTTVYVLNPFVVTATRSERRVSEVAQPVALIAGTRLQEKPFNTISDLFRELPGVDVTGVGVNQVRPVIRGQRGQRVLLLQDGLRLNNSRRQQDFGELPALVDVGS